MSTLNAANTGIYAALTASTALTSLLNTSTAVYNGIAPDSAPLPYVVFNQQGGGPINDTPSDFRMLDYWVRGYAANQALAGTIDAQISAVLHRGALSVSGYTHIATIRNQDIQMVELEPDGTRIYTAGATYTVTIDD